MKYGLYIDFDNLIGGFKAVLGIKQEKALTDFQKQLIPVLLKIFLQNLNIEKCKEAENYSCLYKKAFAEYENLPLKNLLRPQPAIFLHSIGIKPINPFVVSSSSKNKNASDITLTLEVVDDVLLKKNPIDAIAIFSGDIDFYPLIGWIREHTAKNIYLISWGDRIKKAYFEIFSHLLDINNIFFAENFLLKALYTVSNKETLKVFLTESQYSKVEESFCKDKNYNTNWIVKTLEKIRRNLETNPYFIQIKGETEEYFTSIKDNFEKYFFTCEKTSKALGSQIEN